MERKKGITRDEERYAYNSGKYDIPLLHVRMRPSLRTLRAPQTRDAHREALPACLGKAASRNEPPFRAKRFHLRGGVRSSQPNGILDIAPAADKARDKSGTKGIARARAVNNAF